MLNVLERRCSMCRVRMTSAKSVQGWRVWWCDRCDRGPRDAHDAEVTQEIR